MSVLPDSSWRIHGLDVRAPWPLSSNESRTAEPDLTLELLDPRPTPKALEGDLIGEARVEGRVREAAYLADGRWSLLFPNLLVASFDMTSARCRLQPHPTAPEDLVRRLAATAVVATWMILSDIPVLHASAVQVDDSAVVILGASGSGKSTVAAALVGVGATAITDDVCRFTEVDGQWMCHPDAGEMRLREGSAALAALFSPELVERTVDRVVIRPPTTPNAVPVAAIVIPRISSEATAIRMERVRGRGSVLAILEHPRMASLHGDEHSASLFRFASTLVEAVPVWDLVVPRGEIGPALASALSTAIAEVVGE